MFSIFSKSKKSEKSPSPAARAVSVSGTPMRSTRRLLSQKGSIDRVVNPVTKKLLELNIIFEDLRDKYIAKEKELNKVGILKTERERLEKELEKIKVNLEKSKNKIVVYLDMSIRSVTRESLGGKAKNRTQKNYKK